MALLRGGQTDEYYMFIYVKTNNDYRDPTDPSNPHVVYTQVDLERTSITAYEKIKAGTQSMLKARGIDTVLLLENKLIHEGHNYIYVVKYGDEIPADDIDQLLAIDVDGENNQFAVVISRDTNLILAIQFDPREHDLQDGVGVPHLPAAPAADEVNYITNYGGQQRRARTRRHRKARRSTRKTKAKARRA